MTMQDFAMRTMIVKDLKKKTLFKSAQTNELMDILTRYFEGLNGRYRKRVSIRIYAGSLNIRRSALEVPEKNSGLTHDCLELSDVRIWLIFVFPQGRNGEYKRSAALQQSYSFPERNPCSSCVACIID